MIHNKTYYHMHSRLSKLHLRFGFKCFVGYFVFRSALRVYVDVLYAKHGQSCRGETVL